MNLIRCLIQQIHQSLMKWFQFLNKWQKVMLKELKGDVNNIDK